MPNITIPYKERLESNDDIKPINSSSLKIKTNQSGKTKLAKYIQGVVTPCETPNETFLFWPESRPDSSSINHGRKYTFHTKNIQRISDQIMQIISSISAYQIQDHFDAKNKLAKYSRCWNTNEEHLSENTWFCQNTCQHQNTLTISPFGIFWQNPTN